jgi:hypothetical protein
MYTISDTDRSESPSEESWEDGSIEYPIKDNWDFEELISQANSVHLTHIFDYYNIYINIYEKHNITCPFHKGGKENSPSLTYFHDTNTFHCHSCKAGSRPCDFVSLKEGITKAEAAKKIMGLYGSETNEEFIVNSSDYADKLDVLMQFSNWVRYNLQNNLTENRLDKLNVIQQVFDSTCIKHDNMKTEDLKSLISFLKEKL